ncbi:MAG: Maf family protein [Patescibacteria group bacterium]
MGAYPTIVLASGSARRRKLLEQLIGKRFSVIPSSYQEDNSQNVEPPELVTRHALGKALQVAEQDARAYVIGADTVIVHRGMILGKPHTEQDAIGMLKRISGATVECLTGVALVNRHEGVTLLDREITLLSMAAISSDLAEQYVRLGESLDRAGGFAVERHGALLVKKISGCYYNVVGLPLYKLAAMLERAGVRVLG